MSLTTPKTVPVSVIAFGLVVPLVTIIGLLVLLALHDIEPSAGLALIAALAGVHGGAAVATNVAK